ncbi:hypothetical protein [Neisseria sp.]|uniref:hypothetical protein n=1 Tax=Neisseria sp. TaxID=192066 RepID=UPI0026DB52D4|nr:hypothetical protein [Neisseria sp.]MDO4907222.1 hypothetical protein [Neisseria sp.]
MSDVTEWEDRKKSISEVIQEMEAFEDKELVVVVTGDEGKTFKTVKLISKGFEDDKVYCALYI